MDFGFLSRNFRNFFFRKSIIYFDPSQSMHKKFVIFKIRNQMQMLFWKFFEFLIECKAFWSTAGVIYFFLGAFPLNINRFWVIQWFKIGRFWWKFAKKWGLFLENFLHLRFLKRDEGLIDLRLSSRNTQGPNYLNKYFKFAFFIVRKF